METAQELQFKLMEIATFNSFDGKQVVKDLKAHKNLWIGVVMDRPDLIKLRDIHQNYWNVDTVYILSSGTDDEKLELLAKSWQADEVGWITNDYANRCQHCYMNFESLGTSQPLKVLRVWWD